ncbi:MAG TPA: TonB-dependent receptor [Gemmatimonadales bacterium]|nr:TonB-dependent receptor [Gemmatimonadales bacterium]
MKISVRAFLLVLPLPAALASQTPTDTVKLNPVVVTATRVATLASDVPVAVTVLRGEELAAHGIRTVFEALREVPGAVVVQTGSFGGQASLFLRGGQSNYVKVLVDGVPVNQPGGSYDFANLTTDNVERIEVVRGPASVLYGSDAVTGVVQILTRRGGGTGRAEGSVNGGGGTYGSSSWHAESMGGTEAASYSLSISRFTSNGMYAFNNQYRNTAFSGLVRVAAGDGTDAVLSLRYHDNSYHFPTDGNGNPVDHNQFSFESGPTIAFDIGHSFTPRLEARLLLAGSETDGGFDNRPDSTADSALFRSLDNLRRLSADLRANLRLPSSTVLTAGGALEQERDRGFNTCRSSFGDCTTPPIDSSRWNGAFYAQAVTALLDRVDVTAGVRLEDNQRFGTYATYRLGATYRLPGGTRVRATGGNAFREPSFFENYSTGFSVGNPDLKPEHSRSWEVGLEQSLAGGRASLSATFFDQRFLDMIDYNPNVPAGSPNFANVASASANGVELGVRYGAVGPLWAAASYTYLHTDVTNPGFDSTSGAQLAPGQPFVRRPKHSGRLDVGYGLSARAAVSLAATYVGDRLDRIFPPFPAAPRRVPLPSYVRVDWSARFDALVPRRGAPGLAVSVRVENLFDHPYEEVKNFPARRRTVFVGGELRFGRQ